MPFLQETQAAQTSAESASYRDPAGQVFYRDGHVFRGLTEQGSAEWLALSSSRMFEQLVCAGKLIATHEVEPVAADGWAALLRHEAIPLVSYPFEWSFGMLQDAALLQLEVLAAALAENLTLKDGAAANVQWRGARPVFIDVPSLVRWQPGTPWLGYRQFCQTCLFPLMLQAYRGVPFQPWLRGRLEGISAAECNALMRWRDLWRPGVFLDVFLQARWQRKHQATTRNLRQELRNAGFGKELIQANVRRLTKVVRKLRCRSGASVWSSYDHDASGPDQRAKEDFVRAVLAERPRGLVWDLGANTGRYARLAAEYARYVLALDADAVCVERLFQDLKTRGPSNILPLVGNLADPTPGLGWRGLETKGWGHRGRPDLVLCLALVHHLALAANLPLRDVVHWLADQTDEVVLEFVTRPDPRVQQLLRHKDHTHPDYELANLERWLAERFHVRRRQTLPGGTRILFHVIAQ